MSRAERIAKQLGMSQGAANNKLRKAILFDLCRQLKLNTCFKCKEPILTSAEFSVEHKLPWEGRDPKLFWDLSNIAFSHVACNRPHVFSKGNADWVRANMKKIGPDGTSWCTGHERFEPVGNFSSKAGNRSRNGLQYDCKDYRSSSRKV